MIFKDTERPQLLLDTDRCRKNIRTITEKCIKSSCQFRPHFKTHQSIEIGRWFRDYGIKGITVSTPEMAGYFAEDGWIDITIAFPFYRAQTKSIKKLQQRASLRLFVNNQSDLIFLDSELEKPISFYIELDNGYHRSGISASDHSAIDSIIDTAASLNRVHFHGFYIHDGRTYQARSASDIQNIIEPEVQLMKEMKASYPDAAISMGDTPSASALPAFESLDECTAGNFVFYDWMQYNIGSCSLNDIALFHILPVVQTFPADNRAICHGGAVHCSKDYITDEDGSKNYGQVVSLDSNGSVNKMNAKLEALSQEHGMLRFGTSLDHMKLNNYITIVPVHSCLTANLYDRYYTSEGNVIKKKILS